jgi:hypothetical protein
VPNVRRPSWFVAAVFTALFVAGPALGQVLRVVTYNSANDIGPAGTDTNPPTTNGPAGRVLQAIGALNVSGSTRPIDILALQESVYFTGTGPNPTAQAFANVLNNIYPGNTYAVASLVNGTTTGPTAGNGPNTLVYRTTSVQLMSQQALGTPNGDGISRQVMEYQFQPIGYPTSTQFYVFNSHFKAGTTTSDNDRRGVEASLITTRVNDLPANTPIIFAGDYNPTNNTADQGYQGVVSGPTSNRAIDPLNPNNVTQNWNTSAFRFMETASTDDMNFRDDFLMNSPAMQSGSAIHYLLGSYVAFGNTNTHTYQGAITTGSASAFAAQLSGYTTGQASQILSDLVAMSDHLPVVADYQLTPVPEPSAFALVFVAVVGVFARRRGLQSAGSRRDP